MYVYEGAHFRMNTLTNYKIRNDTNSHEIQEHPMHSEKVTVWCGGF